MAPVAIRAAPAERENSVKNFLIFVVARSRSVARSGTKPVYQNSTDTVK
jgi:hypothetical protein